MLDRHGFKAIRQKRRDVQRQRFIVDQFVQQYAGNRRGQNPGAEVPAGIQIPLHAAHRPQNRQLIRRTRAQSRPRAFQVHILELWQTAHRALHQPGNFRIGGGDVEAFVFGGAANQDFTVVLLRHVAITGGQAAVEDFRQAFGQQNLALHRFYRNTDAGRPLAQICRPGTARVDQGFAVEHTFFRRLHAGHPRTVMQHTGHVSVDVDIDAVLPRAFGVGIGETERADLMVAEEFKRSACFVADTRFSCAQLGPIQPAHLIGQMRNAANNVLGVQPILFVINNEFQPGFFELEIHPVVVLQLTVQRRVQRVGLQGKVEE